MIDQFKNPDGKTYNGVKLLAAMSGLPEAEIVWMAERLRKLMREEGKTKDEAKAIVAVETKDKPWLKG